MSTASLLHWFALIGGADLAVRGYLTDRGDLFHAGAWLLAFGLALAAARLRRGRVAAAAFAAIALVPAALSALALAGLPREAEPAPGDPSAFWARHADARRTLIFGDPQARETGSLSLFGQRIAIDAHGFRKRPENENRNESPFRIVAFGDSTTFGATRSPEDLPWPALLEDAIGRSLRCARPVEVINAGTLGRGYAGIIASFANDVTALGADLVVYYPGPRDLGAVSDPLRGIPDAEPVPPRAAAALRWIESVWRARRTRHPYEIERERELPDDLDLRGTALARAYRKMILEARERGIDVALATIGLAVTPDSPDEEIARYEAVEPGARRLLLAKQRHTLLARQVSAALRGRLVDGARDLDGGGDAFFVDLWHLTQAGRERLAETLLAELADALSETPAPGCRPRS